MSNKFQFYEVVKIQSKDPIYVGINDCEGIILGMAQNDDGTWGYAVFVENDTWDINESNLFATGKFSSRESFYSSNSSVKVIVDESGKGKLADESSDSENL